MNDMSSVPEAARLRNVDMAGRVAAAMKARLTAPVRAARRSLAARITLAATGITVLLVVIGLAVGTAMRGISARTERERVLNDASLASTRLTASIADTRYYASRYAATGAPEEIQRLHATLDRAKAGLASTRETSAETDAEAVEAMKWLEYQVAGFENELAALEHAIDAYGPSPIGDGLARAIDISGEQLAEQARGVESRLGAASEASAQELSALNRRMAIIVGALLAACIAITFVGARFLNRTAAGSIREITAAMSSLASGDRSAEVPGKERQDEIGEMARALTVFREDAENLARLQEQAADAAREELARQEQEHSREEAERRRKAELLRELAVRFEHTVGDVVTGVAAASQQLEVTASAMAATATQSAQLSGEVTRSMMHTNAGVTAAASATDQFAMSIAEISRLAAGSAALAEQAGASAHAADRTIAALASAAEAIEEIVGVIDGVAQRTSLLALNASIEAARSGEAGKGFAVVAGEVKVLAGQTREATGKVAEQIRAIQGSAGESVTALRRIGEQVHQLEGSAVAIAQAVDEQSMASRDLAQNLAIAAGGTDEIGRSMGQVRETTQSTGDAASQLLQSASDLHRQAASLRMQMDEFLGYVRAA